MAENYPQELGSFGARGRLPVLLTTSASPANMRSMRWDSQRVEREQGRSLPGLDVERVRTFDAPEALGINFHEVRAKSGLNKVPGTYLPFNWTINAYRGCAHACQFCFARNTHTYLDLNAGRDFEREIVVKVNVPELVRAEISRATWKRELVAIGTNTDPYQWAEGRYRLMPPILEALRDTRTPVSVLSKSPLPLRDLDLYRELAEVVDVSVNFSVPTLDEKVWRETEPHTPHPRKRLEAVARFNEAGIPSGVLVAPLMPGINDSPELVEEIVSLAEEAGATFVNGIALHLRPGVKEVFMSWLSAARPDLVPRYEDLYRDRAYAPNAERNRIAGLIRAPNRSRDPRYRRRDELAERRRARAKQNEAPEAAQTTLF
jgi:DNA repair photolyase